MMDKPLETLGRYTAISALVRLECFALISKYRAAVMKKHNLVIDH